MSLEIMGPSGVGKTFLLNELKNKMWREILLDDECEKIEYELLRSKFYDSNGRVGEIFDKMSEQNGILPFVGTVHDIIGKIPNAACAYVAKRMFDKSIITYNSVKAMQEEEYVICGDEMFLHRIDSIIPFFSDWEENLNKYLHNMPLPSAAVILFADSDTIIERVIKRGARMNIYHGSFDKNIKEIIERNIEIDRVCGEYLQKKNVRVCYLDSSKNDASEKLELFIKETFDSQISKKVSEKSCEDTKINEERLLTRVINESGSFHTSRVKGADRHYLKTKQIAYCTFNTKALTIKPEDAQRNSQRRFEKFGLTTKNLAGKSVLDLGCNCGAMLLEASNHGIAYGKGIEYDQNKVELANDIAKMSGLKHIRFEQGNIDSLKSENTGYFDIVFAFAIEAHVADRIHLMKLLAEITRDALYFEGNGNCNIIGIKRELLLNGFKKVKIIGYCNDDARKENNVRPLLIAYKDTSALKRTMSETAGMLNPKNSIEAKKKIINNWKNRIFHKPQ